MVRTSYNFLVISWWEQVTILSYIMMRTSYIVLDDEVHFVLQHTLVLADCSRVDMSLHSNTLFWSKPISLCSYSLVLPT